MRPIAFALLALALAGCVGVVRGDPATGEMRTTVYTPLDLLESEETEE